MLELSETDMVKKGSDDQPTFDASTTRLATHGQQVRPGVQGCGVGTKQGY
jgi:hypothetical protein